MLRALEALRVPRLFVLIAAFMYRYLFVIVEEVGRMRAALSSRGYRPRHALQAAAIGRMSSALFLRTYARGERVYLAMQARGYRGQMPQLVAVELRGAPTRRSSRSCCSRWCRCGVIAGVSCAVHASGADVRLSRAGSPRCAASTFTSSTASASPCSAPTAPARRR